MTNLPPVLYRGSVKNVRGEVSAKSLVFEFSDRYSVFDWGEMPDQLNDKGLSLALMGKSFFQFLENPLSWKKLFSSKALSDAFSADYLKALENSAQYIEYCKNGLKHHAQYLTTPENLPIMTVQNIKVLRPAETNNRYDYSAYVSRPVETLVPLEIIFRLGLPQGNSLSKRLGEDLSKWRAFGFESIPEFGMLKTPAIDFSTKLERGDRYLDYVEAQKIAGINDEEWINLQQMTHLIALNLYNFHHELGLKLIDGKLEMAFVSGNESHRNFMLVDSIGIDELRLHYKDKSFSKEFLRESYKDSAWYDALEKSKKESLISGVDFKTICLEKYHLAPEALSPKILERAQSVYKSYANAVTQKVFGQKYFSEDFSLENYSQRYM